MGSGRWNLPLLEPKSAAAATDLDLISYLRAVLEAQMRRGGRFPAWYLLFVAMLGILSGWQGIRNLERLTIRHHVVLTEADGRGAAAAANGFRVSLLFPPSRAS